MHTKYVIITPVRDEEKRIEHTIRCVINQTAKPSEWIIVDDGSTDRTREIVENYTQRYVWIRLICRENRGFRKSGAGVVEAFYDGYSALRSADWEFLVKLDGDMSFSPDYFERLFRIFQIQPRLGIAGGDLYHSVDGKLQLEKCPRFHVRGATKVYRSECWAAIGGLLREPGWDIVDETKANMLGWTTESFPDLRVVHQRLTGTAESKLRDQIKNGHAYYVAGYHPLFMAAKCVYRLFFKPYLIGSAAMAFGFISARMAGARQCEDPALLQYIRRQQVRRLLGRQTIWK